MLIKIWINFDENIFFVSSATKIIESQERILNLILETFNEIPITMYNNFRTIAVL